MKEHVCGDDDRESNMRLIDDTFDKRYKRDALVYRQISYQIY